MQALHTDTPPVVWVDDVAAPIATASAARLQPLAEQTLSILHSVFHLHGLCLNLSRGKTEAVLMHRGHESNQFRTALFDRPEPPRLVASTDSHVFQVNVVASYRHLGSKMAMDADIAPELDARLGMARSAYNEMRKPIFNNRHIPAAGRLQLFQSLIMSRLFYGSATWCYITSAQMRSIEHTLTTYYRRILDDGWWHGSCTPAQDLHALHRLPSFRIVLAKTRLIYLRHLALHGLDFHLDLLRQEFTFGTGWLCEVFTDLQWMHACAPLPFPLADDVRDQDWDLLFQHLRDCTSWKAKVNGAVRKHLLREMIAHETQQLHTEALRTLQTVGVQLDEPPAPPTSEDTFHCDECEVAFPTARQLANHQWSCHGSRSIESGYIQPQCVLDVSKTIGLVLGFTNTFAIVLTDVGIASIWRANQMNLW